MTHYKYPPQRDVVVIFGAGASYADGAPLQEDLVRLLLSDSFSYTHKSPAGAAVLEFLREFFAWDSSADSYPPLEAVFALLDHLISHQESLGARFPLDRLSRIRESLILVIHHLISARTDAQHSTYGRFWKEVGIRNTNVSVITLNYDTLLDEAFDPLFPHTAYIDYCIDLLNYDQSIDIDPFDWWINPRDSLPEWASGKQGVPIKLIRPHGSLSWKYCNSCNGVLLTPWNTVVDLASGGLPARNPATLRVSLESEPLRCPRDGTVFRTLIVPPSYTKPLANPRITQLMLEAAAEIRATAKIVFVGYSLPDADVHIKALLSQNLRKDARVIVVDPAESPDFRCRYRALDEKVEFVGRTLQEVLGDGSVLATLLGEEFMGKAHGQSQGD